MRKSPEEAIDILKQLVKDWESGAMTSDSSMIALSILLSDEPPSEACTRWAKQAFEESSCCKRDSYW